MGTIPSLDAYLLVEPDEARVTVWRRGEQAFESEIHTGLDAVIDLPTIGVSLPLADIYDGVLTAA